MIQLAERFAELKGTKVISFRFVDNSIIFVLESGQKYTYSTRQLEEAIAALTPDEPEPEQIEEVEPEAGEEIELEHKPKKKGKKK